MLRLVLSCLVLSIRSVLSFVASFRFRSCATLQYSSAVTVTPRKTKNGLDLHFDCYALYFPQNLLIYHTSLLLMFVAIVMIHCCSRSCSCWRRQHFCICWFSTRVQMTGTQRKTRHDQSVLLAYHIYIARSSELVWFLRHFLHFMLSWQRTICTMTETNHTHAHPRLALSLGSRHAQSAPPP